MAEWGRPQIWYLSYPGGEPRRITNDLNTYGSRNLGLTADSTAIVTVQEDVLRQIWVTVPNDDATRARLVANGKFDGFDGVAWTPEGKIVYVTQSGESTDIWIMNGDGSENKQLTADAFMEYSPTMTVDGRYIVFVSNRAGVRHLWRINADGSDAKQLTDGTTDDVDLDCSPDGQWVAFSTFSSDIGTIWKIEN